MLAAACDWRFLLQLARRSFASLQTCCRTALWPSFCAQPLQASCSLAAPRGDERLLTQLLGRRWGGIQCFCLRACMARLCMRPCSARNRLCTGSACEPSASACGSTRARCTPPPAVRELLCSIRCDLKFLQGSAEEQLLHSHAAWSDSACDPAWLCSGYAPALRATLQCMRL